MKTISLALLLAVVPAFVTRQSNPQQIADELLAADRAFAAAAAKTDLISGLSAMFAAEVVMPAPTGVVYGSDKAMEALRANPANTGAKVEWAPARVGLSGDGRHGFTAGFMTVRRADGTVQYAKYMAYWEKQPSGWRALAYKRAPANAAAPSIPVGYVLPKQIAPVTADASTLERHRNSLADAERAFSRDAQTMGIGAAFKLYGSPEAANFGGPDVPTFVFGNDAIGESVGRGVPPNTSTVTWGPEKTYVAASGDFGVSVGYIVPNKPGPDGKPQKGFPFFTIWKRDGPGAPWRYIAE